MAESTKPAVLFIVGATASGKTGAALALASRSPRPVEIVNADSRQVYRGMSIGTAKPAPAELARVRHHLIDVADPPEGFSLAAFLGLAREAIADILGRGAIPVVVGGTGQYVWGLAEGWQAPEVPPQAELRASLERRAAEEGSDALHERLAELDPDAAAFIDPRNVRRVVRALEVIEVTGAPFSGQRGKVPPDFAPSVFGLRGDRAELHARISLRVGDMIAAGWVDEVRSLLDTGYRPELPAFSSVGYREIAAHLAGESTLEEAIAQAKSATQRLARSQGTWFKANDDRISWHDDAEGLVATALTMLSAD